ncbi:hypothetical protein Vadar_011482 [Vaccinium darrowii]|uniref:Uncharacterized protein n=1 Tax=Vaccinium darrowii TaxID=229202 RepID=A0ACB7YLF9_9ERIC|nr:hypothetical protein Vadar_011482 [Vaccinium darrowii]
MIFPIFVFVCVTSITSGSGAILPPDEVEALKEIGKKLGKTYWNFSVGVDPCSGENGTESPKIIRGMEKKGFGSTKMVLRIPSTCDCS